MKPHPTSRRAQHGGISVGTLLMICVVLLLIALGTVGYFFYQTYSGKREAETKRADAERQLAEEKAKTTSAEADKVQQERQNRLAIAQSLRDNFASRAGVVTNSLQAVLERLPEVQRQLDDFQKGSAGIPLTRFPDLVESASTFLSAKVAMPKRSIGVTHLEGVRRILLRNAENRGTETQPTVEAEKIVDDARSWADAADAELTKASTFMKSMLEEAEAKIPEPNASAATSLEAAIQSMRIGRARLMAQAEAQAKKTAEQLQEEAKNKNTVDEGARRAKELEEENARKQREADSFLAKQRFLEEARSPQIRQILTVVASSGILEADGKPKASGRPGPMSYKALISAGCAQPGTAGMTRLYAVGCRPGDKERPRWPLRHGGNFMTIPELREAVTKAQDALIRLGPYLVEVGVLEP